MAVVAVGWFNDGPSQKKTTECNDLLSRGWRYTKAASAKGDKDQVRGRSSEDGDDYVDSELEELS